MHLLLNFLCRIRFRRTSNTVDRLPVIKPPLLWREFQQKSGSKKVRLESCFPLPLWVCRDTEANLPVTLHHTFFLDYFMHKINQENPNHRISNYKIDLLKQSSACLQQHWVKQSRARSTKETGYCNTNLWCLTSRHFRVLRAVPLSDVHKEWHWQMTATELRKQR